MAGRTRLFAVAGALALALATTAGTGVAQAFDAHGSARQVYATGLAPGAQTTLQRPDGSTAKTKVADAQGGVVFRKVKPGSGYKVAAGGTTSGPLTVLPNRAAPPSTDVYDQQIPSSGYGYLTTRDGTQLAIDVHPPQDVAQAGPLGLPLPPIPSGPTPTLIEYSGYGYADPAGPQNGIAVI